MHCRPSITCIMMLGSDGKPWGMHCLVSRQCMPRGSIFTVLVSVLRPSALPWSWSCPCVLVLCLETKTVQDTCWKALATYRLTRNPAGKVLDSDQTWGLWPRWIASRLYHPTFPRSVATLLEVMVRACYFCTGRTYTYSQSGIIMSSYQASTFRNVNVAQI